MKSLDEWLSEYGESHKNKVNKCIHKFAVPMIVFSILGLAWVLPFPEIFRLHHFINWSSIVLLPILLYYFCLSFFLAIIMVFYAFFQLLLIEFLESKLGDLFFILVCFLFVFSWILQFIGHHIEGKKPAFFKDIQFLAIGPLWVFSELAQISLYFKKFVKKG